MATTLEFTEDGKILARGAGAPVQVGNLRPDPPDMDGNRGWAALLWWHPGIDPAKHVGGWKLAAVRFAENREQVERRVRAKFDTDGRWWLGTEAD